MCDMCIAIKYHSHKGYALYYIPLNITVASAKEKKFFLVQNLVKGCKLQLGWLQMKTFLNILHYLNLPWQQNALSEILPVE